LTTSTVYGEVSEGFHVIDLNTDVFGGAFAEGELVVHLAADVVDVIVDHRKGHNNRKDCDDGEGDCRVGDELVGPHAAIGLHFEG
jgi:hypothetical protein